MTTCADAIENRFQSRNYTSLPGKVLITLLCIVPFIIFVLVVNPPAVERALYWISTDAVCTDYETYPRELLLIGTASVTVVWFLLERFMLRQPTRLKKSVGIRIQLVCTAVYAAAALLSSLHSPFRSVTWLGTTGLYEGSLALISYMILFLGMTYFSDQASVVRFFQNAVIALGWIMGILVLLEHMGYDYYNFSVIQTISGLNGTNFYPVEAATISFGNPDYLSAVAAMLLPISLSCIRNSSSNVRLLASIGSGIFYGTILLMTKVTSAIAFGLMMVLIYGLLLVHRSSMRSASKRLLCIAAALAVFLGCCGYLMTRTGNTFSEKLRHSVLGMDPQPASFGLTHMEIQGDTLVFQSSNNMLTVTDALDEYPLLSAADLEFKYNQIPTNTTVRDDGTITFSDPALSMCKFYVTQNTLHCNLGYNTEIKFSRDNETGWMVEVLGGAYMTQVPSCTESDWVRRNYAVLNGRVFIWANTIAQLGDCFLLGHGASTSVFYLTQSDLTALLNIFGTYVLISKPHNWYLQMIHDTGGISLLAMLTLIGVFLYYGIRRCRKPIDPERKDEEVFRMGLFCGMCAYFLTGLFTDSMIYTAPLVWMTFGMAWRKNCAE